MGTIALFRHPHLVVLSSLNLGFDVLVFWADLGSMGGDVGGN